ncbi:MAG: hypothetical protein ABIH28_02825 [archaeon]
MKVLPTRNLEVDIVLTVEEAFGYLEKIPLSSILKFEEKEIKLLLQYLPHQKEELFVNIIPLHCYLGEAKKVEYSINQEVMEQLRRNNSIGLRYFSSGKLNLTIR